MWLLAAALAATPQELRVETADGWSLTARYRAASSTTPGPAVVLLHGLAAGKGEWEPLEDALLARGISTLSVDLRGHGGARYRGEPRGWRTFLDRGPEGQWSRMGADAEAAWRFLVKRGHKGVVLAGASLGANAALAAAARNPRAAGVALLSPGMDYQGIGSAEPTLLLGPRPLLLAASPSDGYAWKSCDVLEDLRREASLPVERLAAPAGHGAQMLGDAATLRRTADWIAGAARPRSITRAAQRRRKKTGR